MTPAVVVLNHAGIDHVVHTYEHDRSAPFGIEAAGKLDIGREHVFKTLVVVSSGGMFSVAVIPVSTTLNLKLVATEIGAKRVALAEPQEAERATGYLIGGISPIEQIRKLATLIDRSAVKFETVFVSGGHRGLEIELSPQSLQSVTCGVFCDLTSE